MRQFIPRIAMLFQKHLESIIFRGCPNILSLDSVRSSIPLALFIYPRGLCAERILFHLGKIQERFVLLCPFPEFVQIDNPPAVFTIPFNMNRQSAFFNPAFHFVAVRRFGTSNSNQQLIQCHIVTSFKERAQSHLHSSLHNRTLASLQMPSDRSRAERAPHLRKIFLFFGRPVFLVHACSDNRFWMTITSSFISGLLLFSYFFSFERCSAIIIMCKFMIFASALVK